MINVFIRLQDMAQRKRVDNDDKDCDGSSDIIFVKKAQYLAEYEVLHQKSVNCNIIRCASRKHKSLL